MYSFSVVPVSNVIVCPPLFVYRTEAVWATVKLVANTAHSGLDFDLEAALLPRQVVCDEQSANWQPVRDTLGHVLGKWLMASFCKWEVSSRAAVPWFSPSLDSCWAVRLHVSRSFSNSY